MHHFGFIPWVDGVFFLTVLPWSTLLVPQILELSLIHNAKCIMLNDFAKPKASSKSSEYDISLCIHNYALCINEWYELSKKTSIGGEQ